MARHTRQIIGGTVALAIGVILGHVTVAHGPSHGVLVAIAFAIYTPGLVLLIVGLVGYAGPLPLAIDQRERRGRAHGWTTAFVVWTLLAVWVGYGLTVWIVKRLEGQSKPTAGVLIFYGLVFVGLLALARHALARARRRTATTPAT